MLKLYQRETCYYCVRVREKLADLKLSYIAVNVPPRRADRSELLEISGQTGVPTLVTEDGQIIADDDDAIVDYLNKHYGK